MISPKMNTLIICLFGLGTAIEFGNQYEFSFMGIPAFLALLILCIALIYFLDSWFYMIWGLLTGVIIFVPIIIALFTNTGNIASFIFDGILSMFLFIFFGFNLYKRIKKEPDHINKLYKKFKS
ncbi:MAG: hypothetical protein RR585_13780 [Coprobacillus sp.]